MIQVKDKNKKLITKGTKFSFNNKKYIIKSSGITHATGVGSRGGKIYLAKNPRKGIVEIYSGRTIKKLIK